MLQLLVPTWGPTVSTFDTPPDPQPVASDMIARNVWFSGKGTCAWNAPWPFVKLDSGILNVLGVPNS